MVVYINSRYGTFWLFIKNAGFEMIPIILVDAFNE